MTDGSSPLAQAARQGDSPVQSIGRASSAAAAAAASTTTQHHHRRQPGQGALSSGPSEALLLLNIDSFCEAKYATPKRFKSKALNYRNDGWLNAPSFLFSSLGLRTVTLP